MALRQKFTKGSMGIALGTSLVLGAPMLNGHLGSRPAMAQPSKRYDPDTDPLAAGARISAIAKKAKKGNDLESAKELHKLLKLGAPGGLRESKNARSSTRDEIPGTANETMQNGGDCSQFSYVILAALRRMGFRKTGLVHIDLGASSKNTVLMHTIAYVEIDGRRHLVDPQQDEFGKGGVNVKGKEITFTYEELVSGRARVRFVRESPYPKAAGAYHFEWGTYLEGKRRIIEALAAFKKALEIDPADPISKKKVGDYNALNNAKRFNELMGQAKAAVAKKQWAQAAAINQKALGYADSSDSKLLGSLHGNLGICYFNSNDFRNAAIHFKKAFELTGNKKYEAMEKEAEKGNN